MNTRLIISYAIAQVTKGGYGRKCGNHFDLFVRSYSYLDSVARIRYRPRPDADGVTFSFQIGKNKKHWKWIGSNPWHEIWIFQDSHTYYFIPSYVLAEFCSHPSSYRHPEYDPDHRLVHINTQSHQCRYTGKQADFSAYYRATLTYRHIPLSPKLKDVGNQDFVLPYYNH